MNLEILPRQELSTIDLTASDLKRINNPARSKRYFLNKSGRWHLCAEPVSFLYHRYRGEPLHDVVVYDLDR